ncbi:cell division cycle-associated 7-like protein [Notolabrus celidotus]|uniref:cell division cycle-associated 7-like protein n=1 Tax=Notolabrus celidotus TaxID=1203425 RepID=UPI00149052B6|nr:cell division cycle-associated 7-like protein [Notolabrus celidotus]
MTLTTKALRFKSKFITTELARLFSQSDSEEEFEGFSEDEEEEATGYLDKRLKTKMADSEEDSDVDTGFYSDGEDAAPPKRKSLLVALRFPVKRLSTPKQDLQKKNNKRPIKVAPPPRRGRGRPKRMKQQEDEDEDEEEEEEEEEEEVEEEEEEKKENKKEKKEEEEEKKKKKKEEGKEEVLSQSLRKRDKNIQENKAMLAKLFADLSTVADLIPPTTPQKKKRGSEKATARKRKFESESGLERRNPSRKARPPENFAVEEKSEPVTVRPRRTVDLRKLVEVDEEQFDDGKKKKKRSSKGQYLVRSVDEITDDDLLNIAYRSKDKIWDKENGSSCHQCRQKTLDTKTVCRSGFCVGVKGQFCGPCLKNRYGEDVRKVLLDPTWSCPICREMCNCSLCRKKEGRCATGILVGLARYNGHNNVHEYLESIQKELQ